MKLMADEEVLLELAPAPGLLGYWMLTRCLPLGIALGCVVGGAALVIGSVGGSEPAFMPGVLLPGVLGGLVAFVLATVYAACLRRSYHYYVTDRRCAFSGGILLRIRHSVPYHKITDLEQRQNILERLFGVWRLGIYTPGTSSWAGQGVGPRPELAFPGLPDPDETTEAIAEVLSQYRATGG